MLTFSWGGCCGDFHQFSLLREIISQCKQQVGVTKNDKKWIELFDNELGWYFIGTSSVYRRHEIQSKLMSRRNRGTVIRPSDIKDVHELYTTWKLLTSKEQHEFHSTITNKTPMLASR